MLIALLHAASASAQDGANPYSSLLLASDGSFYGTTRYGGASGKGAVFQMTPSGFVTILHFFDGPNGSEPYTHGRLVRGADGLLWGTTYYGGAYGKGTVYRIGTDGTGFQVLHSFNGSAGWHTLAPVIEAADQSALYGVTVYGGASGKGTVFKITTSGGFRLLHSFSGPDGENATAARIQASDGRRSQARPR